MNILLYVAYRIGYFLKLASDWRCLRCGDTPDFGSRAPYCVNCAEDIHDGMPVKLGTQPRSAA